MSFPVEDALFLRPLSAKLSRTGKSMRLPWTWLWLMVIFLRTCQAPEYQPGGVYGMVSPRSAEARMVPPPHEVLKTSTTRLGMEGRVAFMTFPRVKGPVKDFVKLEVSSLPSTRTWNVPG